MATISPQLRQTIDALTAQGFFANPNLSDDQKLHAMAAARAAAQAQATQELVMVAVPQADGTSTIVESTTQDVTDAQAQNPFARNPSGLAAVLGSPLLEPGINTAFNSGIIAKYQGSSWKSLLRGTSNTVAAEASAAINAEAAVTKGMFSSLRMFSKAKIVPGAVGAAVSALGDGIDGYEAYKNGDTKEVTKCAIRGTGAVVGTGVGIWAGVGAGAAAGAAIGSLIPVAGTAIGFVVGGAIAAIGGWLGHKAAGKIANATVGETDSDKKKTASAMQTERLQAGPVIINSSLAQVVIDAEMRARAMSATAGNQLAANGATSAVGAPVAGATNQNLTTANQKAIVKNAWAI